MYRGQYGDVDGWWQPFRIYRSEIDGREFWGVKDDHYNRTKPLLDWRIKGNRKVMWRGSESDAVDLARKLNKNEPGNDRITKEPTSLSQVVRIYQNRPRPTRSRGTSMATAFKRCNCGAMYKGEKHCDQ